MRSRRHSQHKNLLCAQSEFFRASFSNGFSEEKNAQISLPQHSPLAVSKFLDWLYRGRVTLSDAQLAAPFLVPIYTFADSVLCEKYHNDLMDKIRLRFNSKPDRAIHHALKIYRQGLESSQFGIYVMKTAAYSMNQNPTMWRTNLIENSPLWTENTEILFKLLQEHMTILIEKPEAPWAHTGCHYHQHKGGQKCNPKKRKVDGDDSPASKTTKV
jgi:hypothetical protein